MNDWSNVLDSILDFIPAVSEKPVVALASLPSAVAVGQPAPADGFWDVATGDPYRFVGHKLYLDEIEQLANVLGNRDYPMEVHGIQDGELWRVVLIAPKGAQLWTAPSGRLYAGRL